MSTDAPGEDVAKLTELMKGIRIGMLTSISSEGRLTARPMTQQEVEFDGDLWFFIEDDSRTATDIKANSNVGVTLTSSSTWISLAGTATVVRDVAKAKELWNSWVEAWLPEGPEDPNVALIRFSAETGEYWDTLGGRIASVLSFVKAKATGERYEGGDNATVRLGGSA